MRRLTLLALCALSLMACGGDPGASDSGGDPEAAGRGGKADILGEDDRRDLYAYEEGSAPRRLARSTAMILYSTQLSPGPEEGQWSLGGAPLLGRKAGLCEDQPFVEQPSVGFCTAFLVAPDVAVTAGHCLQDGDCGKISILFDFSYEEAPEDPVAAVQTFGPDQVYGCAEVLARRVPSQCGDPDFLVMRLDRPTEGREALRWRRQGLPAVDAPLYMIGHPDGLPTKIATGKVYALEEGGLIKDDLDSFGGSSGSPILNALTDEVEGIRSCASGEHSVPNPEDPSCKILYQCSEGEEGCDFVLGTTYALSEVDFILEALLGLEPADNEPRDCLTCE